MNIKQKLPFIYTLIPATLSLFAGNTHVRYGTIPQILAQARSLDPTHERAPYITYALGSQVAIFLIVCIALMVFAIWSLIKDKYQQFTAVIIAFLIFGLAPRNIYIITAIIVMSFVIFALIPIKPQTKAIPLRKMTVGEVLSKQFMEKYKDANELTYTTAALTNHSGYTSHTHRIEWDNNGVIIRTTTSR